MSIEIPPPNEITEEIQNKTEEEIGELVDRIMQTAMEAFSEGISAADISHNAVVKKKESKWTFHAALYFSITVLTSVGKW